MTTLKKDSDEGVKEKVPSIPGPTANSADQRHPAQNSDIPPARGNSDELVNGETLDVTKDPTHSPNQ
ncbi:MAG: hypothetical protein JO170_13875 [Verrucomicrobia bacterium]|nr:hypothetical protein [Verrucomicrobiota bacterium]